MPRPPTEQGTTRHPPDPTEGLCDGRRPTTPDPDHPVLDGSDTAVLARRSEDTPESSSPTLCRYECGLDDGNPLGTTVDRPDGLSGGADHTLGPPRDPSTTPSPVSTDVSLSRTGPAVGLR